MTTPETLFDLIAAQASATPDAPALIGSQTLSWAQLVTHIKSTAATGPVTAIPLNDPLTAIPNAIAALHKGAALFAPLVPTKRAVLGELIFPVLRKDGSTDLIRHSEVAVVAMAQALVARFGISSDDRIAIAGDVTDPGTWLILAAGFIAGASISFKIKEASILWLLDGTTPAAGDTPRLIHCRADRDTLAALIKAHPNATIINGLTLPEATGLPICSDPRDPVQTIASTCGRPLGAMEVMIVDPRTGMDMLLYETGEVWLRGPGVMAGTANGIAPFEPGRFLRTGILGHLDSEGRLVLSRPEEDALRDAR